VQLSIKVLHFISGKVKHRSGSTNEKLKIISIFLQGPRYQKQRCGIESQQAELSNVKHDRTFSFFMQFHFF
jgi:hypothetical protein